jgi:two-component system KDP operon response regulator KdpE
VLDQVTQNASSRIGGDSAASNRLSAPLVLLAQSDRGARTQLSTTLFDQRLRVVDAETGSRALAQAAAHNPDAIILDYGLPDMGGLQITTALREWTTAPILIMADADREPEKIAVLDAGANEYLTNPIDVGELLARLRVWLRHLRRASGNSLSTVLNVGELRIDFSRLRAWAKDREVRLTPMQYKLFAMMMRSAGRILTHEQILLKVWGPAYTRETQYLRIYMRQLRQKFESNPAHPRYFITEPGIGYRLRND